MSYPKRIPPCQKYKNTKDGLQKSLSATRFVPFRRSSDTTSDSGSDDFKLEAASIEDSFSRSSSESCHSYSANSRYHCILKDLTEVNQLERAKLHHDAEPSESLQDFRSRLNLRRKVKTREVFAYQDDDRTDNSCDSTTTKAHQDILRSANLLKQEQASEITRINRSEQCASFNKRFGKTDESILMNEFDKILQIRGDEHDEEDEHKLAYQQGPSSTISRSSTETFLSKSNSAKAHKSSTSSPRFRPKTHSQMLKAASSIPSLIFSNKSLKLQKSSNSSTSNNNSNSNSNTNSNNFGSSYVQSSDKLLSSSKKNSMDDDFFSIGSSKTRRSPLRFLGNLGRWSSTKRAKSTDEITWALANEDALISSETRLLNDAARNRKKSLGLLSTNSTSSNNTEDTGQDKKRYSKIAAEKSKTMGDLICRKLFDEGYNAKKDCPGAPKMIDLKKRKSSNTSSDILSISGSSVASLNEHSHFGGIASPSSYPARHAQLQEPQVEIPAETLAEIEAFEELLKNHLG